MTTDPSADVPLPGLPPVDPWDAADRAADLNRWARQHPSRRRVVADRVLPPVLVALFVVEAGGMIAAFALPEDARASLRLWLLLATIVSLVLGFGWNWWSERLVFSGAPSILTALPPDARASVRKQIIGRAALDAEHGDTVVELAEQTRSRQRGLLALYSWSVPNLLQLSAGRSGGWALVVLFGALVLVALAFGIAEDRRIARFLREHGRRSFHG